MFATALDPHRVFLPGQVCDQNRAMTEGSLLRSLTVSHPSRDTRCYQCHDIIPGTLAATSHASLATGAGAPLAVGGAFTRRRPQRHDARPAAVVVPRERIGAQRVGGVAASVPGIISWHW